MAALKRTRQAVLLSGASLLVLIAVLASSSYLRGRSVRVQLARLQERTGLSLVTGESRSILAVNFSRGLVTKLRALPGGVTAVSPDGSQVALGLAVTPWDLAISRTDGTNFQQYRNVHIPPNNCVCWSYDNSKLVIGSMNTGSLSVPLQLFDIRSGLAHEVAKIGRVTTQCWSPDNRHFVYESDERVRIYDTEEEDSQDLRIEGAQPTWSPDGKRIAFLDNDTYYAIDPVRRTERLALFKKWHAVSGLWWSPDSRFVAYMSQAAWFEGGLLVPDSEIYWLRVRRPEDNAETRIGGSGSDSYEWVTNKGLLKSP